MLYQLSYTRSRISNLVEFRIVNFVRSQQLIARTGNSVNSKFAILNSKFRPLVVQGAGFEPA